MMKFKRFCPKCLRECTYSRKFGLHRAIRENRVCLSCSMSGRKLSEETKKKLSFQKVGTKNPRFGVSSWNKGKSSWSKGKHFTEAHKTNISKSLVGKPLSEEHKYKLRIATIKDLEKKGISGRAKNHNPVSCGFINRINELFGLSLRHALNGGEVELYGYFVDGYDKEKNIIFEYDEARHRHPYKKKRDRIRQDNLLREIKPTLFIRYDEVSKVLYDVITNERIPLIP